MVKIEDHVEEESLESAQCENPNESDGVLSRRRRVRNSKYNGYVVDKHHGYCPSCNRYVEHTDEGVLCNICGSYWHYKCANTSAEEVEQLGKKHFYCEFHLRNEGKGLGSGSIDMSVASNGRDNKGETESFEESVIDIKVAQYILNNTKFCKDKLKYLDNHHEIKKLDQGKQFTVNVNSVIYFVVARSLSALGQAQGVHIKRKGVDLSGNSTQVQFDVNLYEGNLEVPITMTCFHTTNNIHIQLKGKKKEARWSDKLVAVENFVYVNVVDMIVKVENMPTYNDIRKSIVNDLSISAGIGVVPNLTPFQTTTVVAIGELSDDIQYPVTSMGLAVPSKGCNGSHTDNEQVQTTECEVEVVCQNSIVSDVPKVNKVLKSDGNGLEASCELGAQCVVGVDVVTVVSELPEETTVCKLPEFGPAIPKAVNDRVPVVANEESNIPMLVDDSSKAVVVKNKVDCRNNKQLYQALSVIPGEKNEDLRVKALYSIIFQLKSKGMELKDEYKLVHQPQYSDNLNRVTLKLFEKQKEIDSLKNQSKGLEMQVKELKDRKMENEKDLNDMRKRENEKEKIILSMENDYSKLQEKVRSSSEMISVSNELELAKKCNDEQLVEISKLQSLLHEKDKAITELQGCNKDLVRRCKSLTDVEVELSSRVQALEAVSSHIGDDEKNDIVVIHASSGNVKADVVKDEVASLNQKIEKLNKENSLFKDQLAEKTASLQKIDGFYKEIVDQKDKIICDLQSIMSDDCDVNSRFKRLLLKFRSENELKLMNELKSCIENADINPTSNSVKTVNKSEMGTNTDPVVNSCKCKETSGDGDSSNSIEN